MISYTATEILPKIDGRRNPFTPGSNLEVTSWLDKSKTPTEIEIGTQDHLKWLFLIQRGRGSTPHWDEADSHKHGWGLENRLTQNWELSQKATTDDPKKLINVKDLMCCGQLAPGRFSEGKLLQRTGQKVAPQTPERKLRVGIICERCCPGARPRGRHLMAMLCPQIQPKTATKVCRVCTVGVRSRSSSHHEPAYNLHLTPLFFESLCSLAAACGTAITQNIVYQRTTVAKGFSRMTVA